MSFFYDLNKRLAALATKQEQQQIAESAKAEAVAQSPLTQALNESAHQKEWQKKYDAMMKTPHGRKAIAAAEKDSDPHSINKAVEKHFAKVKEADYSAKKAAAGKDIGKPGKNFEKIAKSAGKKYGSKEAGERVAGAVLNKLRHPKESAEQQPSKGIPGNVPVKGKMERLRGKRDYYEGQDEGDVMDYLNDQLKDYDSQQTDEGNAFSGAVAKAKADGIQKGEKIKVGGKTYPVKEADGVSLEEADLDEAVSRKHFQQIADTLKHIEDMEKRRELAQHHASAFKLANPRFDEKRFFQAAGLGEGNAFTGKLAKTPKGGKFKLDGKEFTDTSEVDEGYAEMDAWLKSREKEKGTGRFDKRKVSTGTVYTRKPETFSSDDEEGGEPTVKKAGRKAVGAGKGTKIGAKVRGTSKLHSKDAIAEEEHVCEMCGQPVVEKAVSKAQQKFMGMVHAAQKGEKPASKEVAKVAKSMKKKDAHDFAATKHKGLPAHVDEESTEKEDSKAERAGKRVAKDIEHDEGHKGKDDNKAEKAGKKVTKDIEYDDKKDRKEKKADKEEKVDETTTSGSVATASAAPKKGGMPFGKGIYESLDRQYTQALTESISIQETVAECGMEGAEPGITIQASGEDAMKLMQLLKLAGLAGGDDACPGCGHNPCDCDAEMVDENSPDWPTNTETIDADPELRTYSSGLNGPKSTGQTTIPVIASQVRRQSSMEESVELERTLFKTWKNYKG